MPHFEFTEVVLVHWNTVNNDYEQDSRVLYTFIPNKSFGKLPDTSKNVIFLKNLWFAIFVRDRRSNMHHFSYQLKCKI